MGDVSLDELAKDEVGDDALDLVDVDVVDAAPSKRALKFRQRHLIRLVRLAFAVNGVNLLEEGSVHGHAEFF